MWPHLPIQGEKKRGSLSHPDAGTPVNYTLPSYSKLINLMTPKVLCVYLQYFFLQFQVRHHFWLASKHFKDT